MKILSKELIDDLAKRTNECIDKVKSLESLTYEECNFKPNSDAWSILECIAHLNLYGDFYIPEIEKRIAASNYKGDKFFNSGWLGNYFANSMLPTGKLNKMKTFADKNPKGSVLDQVTTIKKFLSQQHQLLDLLRRSGEVSLKKTKTSISISKWIKLRLGDTLRVVIYHNQRHMKQIQNILDIMLR